MTAIAHTTRLAALTLLLCGSAFAQTVHIQVNVDARHLHADTESVRVLCRLENGKQSAQGHANLRVKKGRASDTLNVPITIDQAFSQYQSVNCGLQVCKKGASDRCQTPLPHSKGIATAEQYRAYNEGAKNRLTARQPLNQSTSSTDTLSTTAATGSTTGGGGSFAAETSPVVTGVSATTETGVVVEESAFQPITIDVGEMAGRGIRFEPITIDVGEMTGRGIRFEPITIDVGEMTGRGIRFEPITIDVGPMTGRGADRFHTITLNKSGAALGRMFAMLDGSSIAATCLSDCTRATSDAIEPGAIITINAAGEDQPSYQASDDYAQFVGWEGDAICRENAQGKQTSFPLNGDVTCTARFDFVPHEMVTITLKKARGGKSNGVGLLRAVTTDNRDIAICPEGCGSEISTPLPVGTSISITHDTDTLNQFIGWTDEQDCSNIITLERNTTCTAKFKKSTATGFTLTLAKVGSGQGTLSIEKGEYAGTTFRGAAKIINDFSTLAFCAAGCQRRIINNLTTGQIITAETALRLNVKNLVDSTFIGMRGTGPCNDGTWRSRFFHIEQDIYCEASFSKNNQAGSPSPETITLDIEPVIDTDFSIDLAPIPININPHIEAIQ